MNNQFTRRRNIASCSSIKKSHLEKCSNEEFLTLINDETLRATVDFPSALSNVNNVKISDLLAFLVLLLFFSFWSHLKIICDGGTHF